MKSSVDSSWLSRRSRAATFSAPLFNSRARRVPYVQPSTPSVVTIWATCFTRRLRRACVVSRRRNGVTHGMITRWYFSSSSQTRSLVKTLPNLASAGRVRCSPTGPCWMSRSCQDRRSASARGDTWHISQTLKLRFHITMVHLQVSSPKSEPKVFTNINQISTSRLSSWLPTGDIQKSQPRHSLSYRKDIQKTFIILSTKHVTKYSRAWLRTSCSWYAVAYHEPWLHRTATAFHRVIRAYSAEMHNLQIRVDMTAVMHILLVIVMMHTLRLFDDAYFSDAS
jgi:hypothetical protein